MKESWESRFLSKALTGLTAGRVCFLATVVLNSYISSVTVSLGLICVTLFPHVTLDFLSMVSAFM